MSEELLMQDTQPEVEAETTEVETAQAETEVTEEVAEDATETTEAEAEVPAQAETPADEESEADADVEAEPEPPPVVRVKYNKQERTYSTEEAAPLVEMGLKYESFKPHYEKLKFMASTTGQNIPELIDALLESNEQALYEKILEESDGNEKIAKQLHEYQKSERKRRFDELVAQESDREKQESESEREAENNRLAQEFIELKEEVGKFNEFKDIPKTVLNLAAKKKISLLDAYLRYERSEAKKTEAVKAKQAEAAKSSTGPLNTEPEKLKDEYDEVTRAIFGY